MKKWVAKFVLASTADDIKWSKWFWSGAIQLNNAISNGKNSRFMKFLGKKLLGLSTKKAKVTIKGKAGLKIKVGGNKAKNPNAKIAVKKPAVKAKVSVKGKVAAKGKRRLQTTAPAAPANQNMNVSTNGVNLNDKQFDANVP